MLSELERLKKDEAAAAADRRARAAVRRPARLLQLCKPSSNPAQPFHAPSPPPPHTGS
jgi:hypothetical protein